MPTTTTRVDPARVKADLLAELAKLESALRAPEAPDTRAGGNGANDDADCAAAISQHDDAVAVRSRRLVRARDLRLALQRIAARTWGTCAACEGEIGARRLKALPTTEHCVSCAADLETRATRALRAHGYDDEPDDTPPEMPEELRGIGAEFGVGE